MIEWSTSFPQKNNHAQAAEEVDRSSSDISGHPPASSTEKAQNCALRAAG